MRKTVDVKFVARFGKNLRRIRKSKKVSMEKLAYDSGMDYSQVSRVEKGQINTSISTVKVFADSLGVDVHILFQFED